MRDCEHELVIRVEKPPPSRQAGPYIRWYCQDPLCNQEFNPILGPGIFTTWFEVQKMRAQMHRDFLVGVAIMAGLALIVAKIIFF